jgi:hypothetical protein
MPSRVVARLTDSDENEIADEADRVITTEEQES